MDIIRAAELTETAWKNGGGIMREIAGASVDGKSICRISTADVTRNGPFSDYAGWVRILTVIQGPGMALESDEGTLHAKPLSPVRFSGALKIDAHLYDGASTNLNLMFDPDYCDADVAVVHGPCQRPLKPDTDQIFALYGLAGAITLTPNAQLCPGDTALIHSGPCPLALAEGTTVLLVTIYPDAKIHTFLART